MTNGNRSAPDLLHISSPPHIRQTTSTPSMMLSIIIALAPAAAGSVFFFGAHALYLIATCVAVSVATEWFAFVCMKKKPPINDLSAIVTGMLLAMSLPQKLPLWMAAAGALFAICVVKIAFGGLGKNFLNPALAGRAFLMLSFPATMNSWSAPRNGTLCGCPDALSAATPLAHFSESLKTGAMNPLDFQDALSHLFWGNTGGAIGATSAALLLAGALFLWYRRSTGFAIPLSFIGSTFILFLLFNGTGTILTTDALVVPFYQILSGGIMLGALFMANDPVTSPITSAGRIMFGVGCGILTYGFRTYGATPDGVGYAILIMNCAVPVIDRCTRPRRYGETRYHA
jgi:Na+-translocating ferredoxin:NAD+ oxidoreductase subunit D